MKTMLPVELLNNNTFNKLKRAVVILCITFIPLLFCCLHVGAQNIAAGRYQPRVVAADSTTISHADINT